MKYKHGICDKHVICISTTDLFYSFVIRRTLENVQKTFRKFDVTNPLIYLLLTLLYIYIYYFIYSIDYIANDWNPTTT